MVSRSIADLQADRRPAAGMTGAAYASLWQLYLVHMHTGSTFLHQIRVILLAIAMIFGIFGTVAQASGTSSMATMKMSFASASLAADTIEDCTGCLDADMGSVCHSPAGCQAVDLPTSSEFTNGPASVTSVTPVDALARGLAIRPLAQPPKSIIV